MKVLKYLLAILISGLIISCIKDNRNSKYKVVYNKNTDTISKLKNDSITLFFETNFKDDLLKIEINGSKKEYYLNTDMSTGYADYIELGKLTDFKSLMFSINKGSNVSVKDVKSNFIYINYKRDSVVWVDFSNMSKSYK
ncbi:conserved hypothetical protein [Tenacibaculum maritimum]|uniref:hypothetical protein n=1 Tax=Tenacibaculum maritimum TaxID=107401 RepID=UPI0012E67322|nr:hypothetical protein [Tenacibaculum maritimum]CAA0170910.1 Probable lipoprotein precursor [Tenacibaculum maritimum]CAA0204557.1 conserved hypothetical protein [Tenacibaculum maritimum]CAA0204667.1 conserved hypothetical protein [Tenacibaculum maritimum]